MRRQQSGVRVWSIADKGTGWAPSGGWGGWAWRSIADESITLCDKRLERPKGGEQK